VLPGKTSHNLLLVLLIFIVVALGDHVHKAGESLRGNDGFVDVFYLEEFNLGSRGLRKDCSRGLCGFKSGKLGLLLLE